MIKKKTMLHTHTRKQLVAHRFSTINLLMQSLPVPHREPIRGRLQTGRHLFICGTMTGNKYTLLILDLDYIIWLHIFDLIYLSHVL